MILHQSGFWFTIYLTERQRTHIAMTKFEFHEHKAEVENIKSFDKNELRKNLNPAPYKSDIAYICAFMVPRNHRYSTLQGLETLHVSAY